MMGSAPPPVPPSTAVVELLSELAAALRASNLDAKLTELKNYAVDAREAAATLMQARLANEEAAKVAMRSETALGAREAAADNREEYLSKREEELAQMKSAIAQQQAAVEADKNAAVELMNKATADIAAAQAATNYELAALRRNAEDEVARFRAQAEKEIQQLREKATAEADAQRQELQRREVAVSAIEHRIAERTAQLRTALGQ